jgi:uncharacterized membrane protein
MPDSVTEEYRRRSLERVTAFTDAAVAIALTLLVLPLVDAAEDPNLSDHLGDLIGFAVSFLVIAQFWNGHRRLFETLDRYDERLLLLNTLWLLLVVFLPFPTARLFVESEVRRPAAVFYLGTMLGISLLALAMAWYVARHPGLRRADLPAATTRDQIMPTALVSATFALATALALVRAELGLLSLTLLWLVQRSPWLRRPGWDQRAETRS